MCLGHCIVCVFLIKKDLEMSGKLYNWKSQKFTEIAKKNDSINFSLKIHRRFPCYEGNFSAD